MSAALSRPAAQRVPVLLLMCTLLLPVVWNAAAGQSDTAIAALPRIPQVENVSPTLTAMALFLLPKVVADVWRMREYVKGEEFAAFRHERGDLVAVDALFRRALSVSWNNRGAALLIVTLAVMEHRRVGIRTPIPGFVLWLPLTSEFDADFRARVDALPSRLYPDSPTVGGGDRDKLQHFFGSALLALICESGGAARRVGEFVEWGEDAFVVEGVLDERDLFANQQGIAFGLALLEDITSLPSNFMGEHRLSTTPVAPQATSGTHVP